MNFTTLRYFLITAQECSITRAASKLYISQQALSGHISKLERELNVTLFNRIPSLSLTYAGRQLSKYAEKIVTLERELHQAAGDICNDKRGELRIGISYSCGRAILPSILPDFQAAHPLVDIKLEELTSAEMEDGLRRGTLDVMIDFMPLSVEAFAFEKLIEERLLLVVPQALMNACYGACYDAIRRENLRELDLSIFQHFPFILLKCDNRTRVILDAYMQKVGFTPNVILETENVETALALAMRGMGVTTYPELFLWCIGDAAKTAPVEYFPFRDSSTTGTLAIVWMRGHYQTKAELDFIEACKLSLSRFREKARNALY